MKPNTAVALAMLCVVACRSKVEPTPSPQPPAATAPATSAPISPAPSASGDTGHADRGPRTVPPPNTLPAPDRLVGFADVHGDLDATLAVLTLAGVIDANRQWIGGTTVVVQTGDQLDRGDDERAILDLFESLSEQAWAAGGGFYPLLGNHEVMNVALDLRYITSDGFATFADVPHSPSDQTVMAHPKHKRGRVAAFQPGGPYALKLAGHNVAMKVGDTVFVHGGILPEHARAGLDTINRSVQAWIRGEAPMPDQWVRSRSSPVWSRHYSKNPDDRDCALLREALAILDAKRMVVGHTVQDAPNPACDGAVWRMDVGMAKHYGGRPAALNIEGESVTLLQ